MTNKLNQYSTISGLAAGNYEGNFTWKEILVNNNFGLGTFEALDGEMIGFDNQFFKMKSDGSIQPIKLDEKTPFASLTNFMKQETFPLETKTSKVSLTDFLKGKINPNHVYALKMTGLFSKISTRTVSLQSKPYVKLIEAAKTQTVLEKTSEQGTMIGFWTPSLFNTIGVEGLHLHFLNDAKSFGGHVLEFELDHGQLELMELETMELTFDLSTKEIVSNQQEIHQAEK